MFRRNEEETFNFAVFKPELKALRDVKREELEAKIDEILSQINIITKYFNHLSKKTDDSLMLIKVLEERVKDLESRVEALTAREL
ncbi:MAG: hypothetical protein QXM68_02780 [Candidatus Aenigmatarchaeota archaeon]|nr:hypothetical protein [Candidatus Aenigmarchaeota archaeon]